MSTSATATPNYYVPQPSRHPAFMAVGLLLVIFGASQWINGADWAKWVVAAGFLWVFTVIDRKSVV